MIGALAQNINAPTAIGGGTFNGATNITRTGDFTGIADSQIATVSLWYRLTALTGTVQRIFQATQGGNSLFSVIYIQSTNRFRLSGAADAALANAMAWTPSVVPVIGIWYHIFWSATLAGTGATRLANNKVYINGAKQTLTAFTNVGTDGVMDLANASELWQISPSGSFVNGDIAEIWFQDGVFLDGDDPAWLNKFITQSGRPAYLGGFGELPTGVQPRVYIHHPVATSLGINLGTGGNIISGTPDTIAAMRTYPAAGQLGA